MLTLGALTNTGLSKMAKSSDLTLPTLSIFGYWAIMIGTLKVQVAASEGQRPNLQRLPHVRLLHQTGLSEEARHLRKVMFSSTSNTILFNVVYFKFYVYI